MPDHLGVGQGASKGGDALGQAVFGHERIRPDRLHQRVFGDGPFVVRDEEQQRLEGFGRELDWSALTQELTPRNV
jgi:hypothetical protein